MAPQATPTVSSNMLYKKHLNSFTRGGEIWLDPISFNVQEGGGTYLMYRMTPVHKCNTLIKIGVMVNEVVDSSMSGDLV